MITLGELIIVLVAGGVLILFGLVPRLFQRLAEGVREGVYNFKASLSSPFPIQPPRYERIRTPRWWLGGLGTALIVAAVLAYV